MSGKEHQFRKKVSSEPPKRPMSAYFLFLKDVRAGLFKNNPGSSVAEVSKIAGYLTCLNFIEKSGGTLTQPLKVNIKSRLRKSNYNMKYRKLITRAYMVL